MHSPKYLYWLVMPTDTGSRDQKKNRNKNLDNAMKSAVVKTEGIS